MSARQRMNELLNRVQDGTALPEDYRELRAIIDADATGELIGQVHAFHTQMAGDLAYDTTHWNKVVQNILEVDKPRQVYRMQRYSVWIAAAVLTALAIGIYLFVQPGRGKLPEATVVKNAAPVLPGKNGAILTLSDGNTIVLDSLPDGVIAMQGNTSVQLQSGRLQYANEHANSTQTAVSWNTLRTPRGSQYQVVLPDGTKVWLNAASSLRFPTAFTGSVREIEITGEAYLEVAGVRKQPFRVKTHDALIEVLGTHFNINTYEDEDNSRTTLLEGKVKVIPAGQPQTLNPQPVILQPGEQAQVYRSGKISMQKNVNVDEVVAWKNGFFYFDEAALQVVMRQLSRWYDVEVVYRGNPDTRMTFSGKMGRDLRLAQVLKILQKSEVHFSIRDRTIVVMP